MRCDIIKIIDSVNKFIDRVGIHNFLLIVFIFVVCLVAGLYTTFSLSTSMGETEVIDGLTTYKFILNDEHAVNSVTVAANTSKGVELTVLNNSNTKLKYGLYYSSDDYIDEVDVGYTSDSKYPASGFIDSNNGYVVTIRIVNDSSYDVTIDLGLAFGMGNVGAYDYVMGNMVNSSGAFYPSGSGTIWNGSTTLDSMYYNSYSYGTDGYSKKAFNRLRLGDATAESTFITGASGSGWRIGSPGGYGFSTTINGTGAWMVRGGEATYGANSIFSFQYLDGKAYTSAGFRVAIS